MKTKKLVKQAIVRSGVLRGFNISWYTRVNGKRFKIPVLGEIGLSNISVSEPWMVTLLTSLLDLRSNGLFLDIGVNLGQTLVKLKSVNSDTKYIGFEPNPECIPYVKRLIEANNFKNCILLPIGLFNINTILALDFFVSSKVSGGASVIKNTWVNGTVVHKQYVAVCDYDTVLTALDIKDEINIVKIDVEGAELEVIESLHQTLSHNRPFLLIEILPVRSGETSLQRQRQDRIEELISCLNYKIFRIVKDSKKKFFGLQEIESLNQHCDFSERDYLFVPTEMKSEILKLQVI